MLGRPGCWKPLWIKVMAGSWLMASVHMVLMMAMSSTILAVCGISSLIQAPELPYCANLKTDGATGSVAWPDVMPVMRWPMRTLAGRSTPMYSFSFGL